jgi:hypothetical protein
MPQFLQVDTLHKSGDRLPFAPFLKPAKKEENLPKKQQNIAVKKNETTTSARIQALVSDSEAIPQPAVFYNTPHTAFDTLQVQGDTTVQALSPAFRFVDEENDELAKDERQFLNSNAYFPSHLLPVKSNIPQLSVKHVPDWFTVVLLFILMGITIIHVFYRKIFKQLFNAYINLAVTNQVVRDENILVQRASILLNVIFYASAGLFLYFLSVRFHWTNTIFNEGILRFFFFAFITAVFFSLKMLLLKFLSSVFEIEKQVSVYIFSIFLTNNVLGILMVPLMALLAYVSWNFSHYFVYASLGMVLLAFAYLLYRAIRITATMQKFSMYYLFLYFCSLEIAPILVIIKAAAR